jgi:hypothetical protein
MTLSRYLLTMSIATLICWSLWLCVIFTINPEKTNWIGFTLFYVSIFLALSGTFAIAGFFFRFKIRRQLIAFRSAKEAFRQSFLLATLIVASLILLSRDLFSWLNLSLLLLGLTILEFFWLSLSE